ncbi:MAG: hypothetical protein ACRCS3_08550 [Paracoccaceae bacterium]
MQQFAALQNTISQLARQNRDPALQPLIAEAAARCASLATHFDRLGAAQSKAEEIVDAQVFERLMALAGPSTAIELLDQLLIDLDTVQRALAGANPATDWDIMRNQCHVLIAVAGAIGAQTVQSGADSLHNAALNHDARSAMAMRNALLAQLQVLMAFVRDERKARDRR